MGAGSSFCAVDFAPSRFRFLTISRFEKEKQMKSKINVSKVVLAYSGGLDDSVEMNIVVRLPMGIEAADLEQKMLTWCNGAKLSFLDSDPSFRSEKICPLCEPCCGPSA
jgi:hypothetical protein